MNANTDNGAPHGMAYSLVVIRSNNSTNSGNTMTPNSLELLGILAMFNRGHDLCSARNLFCERKEEKVQEGIFTCLAGLSQSWGPLAGSGSTEGQSLGPHRYHTKSTIRSASRSDRDCQC